MFIKSCENAQKLYIYYVYIHIKRVFVKNCNPSLGDPWGIFW